MVVDIILDPSLAKFWLNSHGEADHGDQDHQGADKHVHREATHDHGEQYYREPPAQGLKSPKGNSLDPNSFPVPPENVVVHKGGLNREQIEEVFRGAGLREFEWDTVGDFEPVRGRNVVQLFLATGIAPQL